MRFALNITVRAEADLRDIYAYIAFDLLAPENAARQLGRLESNILKLEQMPERFRRYEREPWKSRGLRVMPVDHYVVLYIPDRETATVTILRVMYGGRDMDAQLETDMDND